MTWPTKKLGDKEFFEILGSGVDKFEVEKEYLSTSSIEGNRIISTEGKITYQKRPSRANMQPRLNSVWFARMKGTVKVYSFTEEKKEEIDEYILSTGFAGILCNKEKIFPGYLEKIFLSAQFNAMKDALASDKAIQPSLTNEDIRNLEVPLLPFPIQQKIVKILDTIQDAIKFQEKIIEKTKKLKRSLMYELFKYGAPSFRKGRKLKKTEIGEIPEDWEVVRLGEICKVKYGKAKPKNSGPFPVVGSSGVFDFVDKFLIEKPTIVIGRKGTAGHSTLVKKPCWPSDTTYYLDIPLEKVDSNFLFEYLTLRPLSGEHSKTTLPSLKREDLELFPIPLPPLPEQREIAKILQTVDQKIEIEQKKKELHEELFKSMLNKLMTGEIRVKDVNFK